MVEITGFTGEPWQVTTSPTGDGHVVHLVIAGVMVILPAAAARMLGTALHAASGIDDESSAGGALTREGEDQGTAVPAIRDGAPGCTPPAVHDIEQHAGYFCATHGFVLIDFCSCPDGDIVSLWTNDRDDDQFVRVLNRYRKSATGGTPADPTVSSGVGSGEHPRTSSPITDARRGGDWETAGLVDLADGTLADDETSAEGAT